MYVGDADLDMYLINNLLKQSKVYNIRSQGETNEKMILRKKVKKKEIKKVIPFPKQRLNKLEEATSKCFIPNQ